VHHRADGGTVAFAPGGDGEKFSERVRHRRPEGETVRPRKATEKTPVSCFIPSSMQSTPRMHIAVYKQG
ncbi:MAG: hypothetical protein ACKOTE_15175, partial [Opitutaceae bacterium]